MRHLCRHLGRWRILGLLAGCASGPAATAPAARSPASEAARPPAVVSGDARLLGANASFADLVRTAQLLWEAGAGGSSGCLLGRSDEGLRLSAELASGLRELPQAPAELDAQLARSRGVAVLGPFGSAGEPNATLALSIFTSLPASSARAAVAVLALTDQGAYVRGHPSLDGGEPLELRAAAALLAHPPLRGAAVHVTAEGSVPVVKLADALAALPEQTLVALSVALPEGTRLPGSARATPEYCPGGLPEPAPAAALGSLDAATLGAALGPLRERAQACLESARGPGRAGGRVKLALRIDASGRVAHACVLEDGVGDPGLLACVLDHARSLTVVAPSPPGFVDAHLPLSLSPVETPAQRPLCQ